MIEISSSPIKRSINYINGHQRRVSRKSLLAKKIYSELNEMRLVRVKNCEKLAPCDVEAARAMFCTGGKMAYIRNNDRIPTTLTTDQLQDINIQYLHKIGFFDTVESGTLTRVPAEDSPATNLKHLTNNIGGISYVERYTTPDGKRWVNAEAFYSKDKTNIYVCFRGMRGDSHEKSNAAKTVAGYISQEMKIADTLIAAYKEKYTDKNIIAVGHSMGGGHATYAALKNQVQAITFNAMGLANHRFRGSTKKQQKRIVQINTQRDPLHMLQKLFLHKHGVKITVPSKTKHGLKSKTDTGEFRLPDELQQLITAKIE